MGYTHYWYRVANLEPKIFKQAVADCKKICEILPIPLGNGNGKDDPIFNDEEVCFNGNVISKGFRTDAGIIPWPTDDAKGFASLDDPPSNVGSWGEILGFSFSSLNSRSVDENGDGSYEGFIISQTMKQREWDKPNEHLIFDFCKTGYRPYDINVQCCLLIFKHHFPKDFFVSSNGKQAQWQEAIDLCMIHLGFLDEFNLEKDYELREAREKELKEAKPKNSNKVPNKKKFIILKTNGLDISI